MKALIKIWAFLALIVLANATVASAQDKEPAKIDEKIVVESPNKNTVDTQNAATLTAESVREIPNPYKNQASDKYRIGFLDTVDVQVARKPELSGQYQINPEDGTISMFRVKDPIIAVCKTERELSNTITAHLKSYLKDPFVTVKVAEQRSQPFAVIGAVQKPGNFMLGRKIRLLELISLAGGPDVEFAGTRVQVARLGNVAGCQNAEEKIDENKEVEFVGFKLNDILTGRANPWMQPGDIVSVLMAEEAYVVGNVLKPTKVTMKEPMTLTQALAAAGGVNKTAKTDKVIIQRQGDNGSKTSLTYNLKDIVSQKIPDPQLQGNDIVQVDTDKVKGMIDGVKGLFKTALPSVFYAIP